MDRSYPAALQEPLSSSPVRASPSVRRTSHMDIVPQLGNSGHLVLAGEVRDLHTGPDGRAAIVAEGRVRAELGYGRRLDALDSDPWVPHLSKLLGVPVGRGFRAAVDSAIPGLRQAPSPLALLLDDLPVAALIAGYADLYVRSENPPTEEPPPAGALKSDICSGWRTGGTMLRLTAERGYLPVPVGPPAPRLELTGDPLSWHQMDPPAPGVMRRRRLIDVRPGDPLAVFAMFRDTYTDRAGTETVLHEYSVELSVDPTTHLVGQSAATPRNLPWPECPAAAASAGWIVGHRLEDVGAVLRSEFRGIGTCTHLNDLVRSLGGAGGMATVLTSGATVHTSGPQLD